MSQVGRNEPCPCGSGRKYKRCCEEKLEHPFLPKGTLILVGIILALAGFGIVAAWLDEPPEPEPTPYSRALPAEAVPVPAAADQAATMTTEAETDTTVPAEPADQP